jgi:hypothetical protein
VLVSGDLWPPRPPQSHHFSFSFRPIAGR